MENFVTPYNPVKILLHYQKWKQVAQWTERMEKYGYSNIPLPPPVTVSVDPSNSCQLNCIGCNAVKVIQGKKYQLDLDYLNSLVNVLSLWGVRGVCCGGGGEATTNTNLNIFAERCCENNIGVGMVTNGLALEELNPKYFKWIGVSVDAGTKHVWANVHGVKAGLFQNVLSGMEYLIQNGVQTTYKYLVRPENIHDVYSGISQAHKLGCFAFHIRPMASPWFGEPEKRLFTQDDINTVNKYIENGKLNFPDFPIIGVFNKLGDQWQVEHPFKKCWAIFATCVFQSNKKVGLCCDLRGCPAVEVGPFDDPEDFVKFWGSKEHFDIQNNINVNKCSRCTFKCLNELFEGAVIQDGFMESFI